jgi:hypothetical protein
LRSRQSSAAIVNDLTAPGSPRSAAKKTAATPKDRRRQFGFGVAPPRPDSPGRAAKWKGIQLGYDAMPFEDRYIWGINAGIVRNFYDRVYG